MDKREIREFFDSRAAGWDDDMVRSDWKIAEILDGAEVRPGVDVLDVATGTGVLIPDYLARNVTSVTGIDISSEMIKCARSKFPQENVSFICGDAEEISGDRLYDCIVVYNAFPHFPDPEALIAKLSSLLRPGGTLTVAHGMSRAKLDEHHSGSAAKVSLGLMDEDSLAAIFSKYLTVTAKVSNSDLYRVTGKKI